MVSLPADLVGVGGSYACLPNFELTRLSSSSLLILASISAAETYGFLSFCIFTKLGKFATSWASFDIYFVTARSLRLTLVGLLPDSLGLLSIAR